MSKEQNPSPAYNIYAGNSISIIVPFFNERQMEKNIAIVEEELKAYFKNFEIIVVSDGSTNISEEEKEKLSGLSQNILFFHYPQNQGKGYALKFGFSKSKGEYVAFIDGGMELHPKDIKRFLVLMDIYNADIVIGSKRHAYSKVDYPAVRRFLSLAYQIFIRLFLRIKHVKDTQVGMKLFRRNVLEKTLPRVLVKKYAFDLELLTVANHLGFSNILEAPIELNYFQNREKARPLRDLLHTCKVAWPLLVDTLAILYRLRVLRHYDRDTRSLRTSKTLSEDSGTDEVKQYLEAKSNQK